MIKKLFFPTVRFHPPSMHRLTPRVKVDRSYNYTADPALLPAENREALKSAIDSALCGTAFLDLIRHFENCSSSIVAVFDALWTHGKKVEGGRAWWIENRFGVDLFVTIGQETMSHSGGHRIPFYVGIRNGDKIESVVPWICVVIGHESGSFA